MDQKILVAEDDEDLRAILTHFLPSAGYKVQSAADGRQALEILASDRFDLLIVDLAMPKVDGWNVIGQFRQRLENKIIPVIALSAHDFSEDRANAFKAGCNEFIAKPFDPYELLRKVQQLLGASAAGPASHPSAA